MLTCHSRTPVQIFTGFKPLTITLSTGLQCRAKHGPFLMYPSERTGARNSVRRQEAWRASLIKSGKPQHLLGKTVFVCIFALEMYCLTFMFKAGGKKKGVKKLVHLLKLTLMHRYQNLVLKGAGLS